MSRNSVQAKARGTRLLVALGAVAALMLASDPARAAETTQYRYDALGRVVMVTASSGSQSGYGYDAAGNRTALASGMRQGPTYPDRLLQGQSLLPGKFLQSINGLYTLTLQENGELAVYGQGGALQWKANIEGQISARIVMQGDGNVVAYSQIDLPLWNTQTYSNAGSALILQGDGNLVVYSASGVPLWNIFH